MSIYVVGWIARIWSIASIGWLFILGDGIHTTMAREWLGLFFFPFGISVGMVLAWRREGFGGSITTGSLLIFYGVHLVTSGRFPEGWAWLVFSTPGFLFLLSYYLSRKTDAAIA